VIDGCSFVALGTRILTLFHAVKCVSFASVGVETSSDTSSSCWLIIAYDFMLVVDCATPCRVDNDKSVVRMIRFEMCIGFPFSLVLFDNACVFQVFLMINVTVCPLACQVLSAISKSMFYQVVLLVY